MKDANTRRIPDRAAEQAAQVIGAWSRADDLGALIMDGPDAAAFLHNMLTADVKRLPVNGAALACQCTPKGETETLVLLVRTGDSRYLIVNRRDDVARLRDALERLHFSEDFRVSDVSDALTLVRVTGPKSALLLATTSGGSVAELDAVTPGTSVTQRIKGCDVRSVHMPRESGGGWLLVVATKDADALMRVVSDAAAKLGLVEADETIREAVRISAGVPTMVRDLPMKALASELGVEHRALNYDKGCYVGQEIIARIRTKGHAPIRVMGVVFDTGAPIPIVGDKLKDDGGQEAGEVTSATFSHRLGSAVAIARIKKNWQVVGTKVVTASGAKGEICVLPFDVPSPQAPSGSLYDSALALFAQDNESEALKLLEQELSLKPLNVDAWEATGVIHDRMGRHRDAVAAMKRIIEIDPKHLMANVNLSMFHMKLGDKATAEEYQAKATQISLEHRMAEARAKGHSSAADADLERIQKTESRLAKFRQIIEMDPGDVLGHFGAGKACLDLKRFGEARAHFEQVLQIQPDYSVAWANLGQAYAALGENDKAKETFERGIEVARGKGDMMPMRDMITRLERVSAGASA